MGATFSRVKNWAAEILSNTDLNAEIDNILNNLDPSGVDDYSSTATQMRLTTDPGEVGSESLATSLAGELERLRFSIKELKGTDAAQWYSSPAISLTDVLASLGGSVGNNRLVTGASSANSGSPRFLVAAGSTTSVTLDAAPTAFTYYINSVQYSATADVTATGLSVQGTANATMLINDVNLSSQETSKWIGEDGTILTVDNMGTAIQTAVGTYAAFKVVSGGSTEYFLGYVKSTTQITNCLRGFFFNSSSAAMPRIAIADNNTITLTKLTWLFANTTAGLSVSYFNPEVSYATPSSTSPYWLDLANDVWKTHNGSNWVTAGATLVGVCFQDHTSCIGARAFDFFGAYDTYSNLQLDYVTTTQVQARNFGSKVSVGTSLIEFRNTRPVWDMTVNLESGYSESASTTYFIYTGDSGQLRISPEKPYFSAMLGRDWYHPYELWRALGSIQNNADSNLDPHSLKMYRLDPNAIDQYAVQNELRNIGARAAVASNALTLTFCGADGTDLSPGNPGFVNFRSSSSSASGVIVTRKLTQNYAITIPQSATLGHYDNNEHYVWGYLIDNNGTIDVGVTGIIAEKDTGLKTTVQITATATNGLQLYSAGAAIATPRATRRAARFSVTEATAGIWATAPSAIDINPELVPTIIDWAGTTGLTPSAAAFGATPLATAFFRKRLGDTVHYRGYFQAQSANAATAQLDLSLFIETSFMTPGTRNILGTWWLLDETAAVNNFGTGNSFGAVVMNPSASNRVSFANGAASTAFAVNNANTMLTSATDAVAFEFSYPVRGWALYGP